jgi:dsDNA-specific endonuclease/ATPase MutS2
MSNHNSVEFPINGTLDLHFFRPGDVGDLIPDYLSECRKHGILQVRIVHGKGMGILRSRVHSILRRLDMVEDFSLAGEGAGGWGATVVRLKPL